MVGLPARGKTFIARKVARYLSWLGYRTHVFNVGNYRRSRLGSRQPHAFFDPDNPEGLQARRQMALAALDDLIQWFDQGGGIGIYDATNSTRERRQLIYEHCTATGLKVLFIESICNDPAVIESNIRETKLSSPDYTGMDPEEAVADFRARIAHYEKAYEPIDEEDRSYVKVIDVTRQLVANRIYGYLPSRLVLFLMNLHVTPRPIWLTRHGESTWNAVGRLGGDASLSPDGWGYARSLAEFMEDRATGKVKVWTSTLERARQTASHLPAAAETWRALDEIDAGICDGMTYAQIEAQMPREYAERTRDKLNYRYPRGESYRDVMQRLEPVIIELERQRHPVLVIAHQAVLRALYAYLKDQRPEDCPHLEIPLHTIIELTPRAYGCEERRYALAPRPHSSSAGS